MGWRRGPRKPDLTFLERLDEIDPSPLVVLPARATAPLRDVVAAWLIGLAPGHEVVTRAGGILAEVTDVIPFLDIAVLPPNPSRGELEDAVRTAFASVDDAAALTGDALAVLALRWACDATVQARMTPQDLCRWASSFSGWDGPQGFLVFRFLEDAYGEAEHLDALPIRELDAHTLAAAAAFLERSEALSRPRASSD